MITTYNIYRIDKSKLPYVIMFGNLEHGWVCTKDELKEFWGKAIRSSQNRHFGDVTLLYNGKLIRSINNANVKILDKEVRYKYNCNKYDTI